MHLWALTLIKKKGNKKKLRKWKRITNGNSSENSKILFKLKNFKEKFGTFRLKKKNSASI